MPKISMLIPDADLAAIDDVADHNRTAFMIRAALDAAAHIKRQREDAEVRRICASTSKRDRRISKDYEPTLKDGLE
ncbi:hypothetical protein EPN52_05865 [bacterium]|nr:MAG: hypothetical protein EPN52_05865 [bacterium]